MSKIEELWSTKEYELFRVQLARFIGGLTRKYYKNFKQTSSDYKELCNGIVVTIYDRLLSGHYEERVKKIQDELGKTIDFRSYLYTEIRGELTKFFNKFNKHGNPVSYSEDFMETVGDEDTYNFMVNEFNSIMVDFNFTIEDDINAVIMKLLYRSDYMYKNIYTVKRLFWMHCKFREEGEN